jgi:hypothetical protein
MRFDALQQADTGEAGHGLLARLRDALRAPVVCFAVTIVSILCCPQRVQHQRSSTSGLSPRLSATRASRSAFRFRRQLRHISRAATYRAWSAERGAMPSTTDGTIRRTTQPRHL